MIPTKGDLSLYTKHLAGRICGLSGVYVDDLLQTGNSGFKRLTELTGRRFDSTQRKFMGSKFMGMDFRQATDHSFELDMDNFIDGLELSPVPTTYELYRSMRAKLAWITNCRPDVACAVAKAVQVTPELFNATVDAKMLNKIIRHLKRKRLKMTFPQLHRDSLHIRAYADASHANNCDLSSQL
eukprot:IDg18036t1